MSSSLRYCTPLFAFAASLAALWASPHAAAQVIPCGTTLTSSVTLQADIVCGPGQNALLIGAHGVTVDLNGHSIIGPWDPLGNPGTGYAIGFATSGNDKVRLVGPGRILGFPQLISVLGARDLYIGKVTAVNVLAAPISLIGLTFSVIEDNEFSALLLLGSPWSPNYANRIQRNRLRTPPGGGGGSLMLGGCESYENTIYQNEIIEEPGQLVPALAVRSGAYGNNIVGNTIVGTTELSGTHNAYRKNKFVAGPGAGTVVAVLGGQSLAVICRHGFDEGSGNTIESNSIDGGIWGVRLQSLPNVIPVKGNRIVGNEFSGQVSTGLFFTVHAQGNDGRGNTYVNVPFPVVDHGSGNLWP